MKCYIDLYTRPRDAGSLREILEAAGSMGYCLVGVEYAGDWGEAKRISKEAGVDIVRVAVVEGASRREVASKLAGERGGSLLFVKGVNQDVARYSSSNKKFAGFVAVPGMERLVDRSTRTLFHERGWGLVLVPLDLLIMGRGRSVWRYYYLVLRRAYAYRVDLALVSAARTAGELWHPLSAIGVGELFGVPAEYASSWLTSSPARLIDLMRR